VIGERVRDKIAASKRKGIWVGGPVRFGYAAVASLAGASGECFAGCPESAASSPSRCPVTVARHIAETDGADDPVQTS